MTGPTAEDVITDVAREVLRQRLGGYVGSSWTPMSTEVAAAVVAAIRDMTAEQQAELIGGAVEHSGRTHLGDDGLFVHDPVGRVIGPWRAEP